MIDETQPQVDEAPLDIEALGWTSVEPTEGFADRVAALAAGEVEPENSSEPGPATHTRVWIALSIAAALLLTVWAVTSMPGAPTRDSLTATKIETVRIEDRAVAVAQPGAVLRWEVGGDGTTVVEQDAGRVFYRVDHGETFDVKTPAGVVTVTGTCFDVELTTMKSTGMKAGALGAALAAAVVVSVYEGGVVLANDKGNVDVGAGQKAVASGSAAPRSYADDDWSDGAQIVAGKSKNGAAAGAQPGSSPEDTDPAAHVRRQARDIERLKAEKDVQHAELERLRKQVEELGGDPGAPTTPELAKAKAKQCATQSRTSGCPFLEPSQETLMEMARCATVKVDYPPFLQNVEPPDVSEYARNMGLTEAKDIEGMQAAADRHYDAYLAELRSMFVDLGGDQELAQEASPQTLNSFIADQVDRGTMSEIQRRIAAERAGISEAPEDLSALPIEERLVRLNAELGNDFERHLAKEIGGEKARSLRTLKDGWPGSTSVSSGECRD